MPHLLSIQTQRSSALCKNLLIVVTAYKTVKLRIKSTDICVIILQDSTHRKEMYKVTTADYNANFFGLFVFSTQCAQPSRLAHSVHSPQV